MENIQYLQEKMIADLVDQLDNMFIKALERKGFHFSRRDYMIEFIKQRCTCVDNQQTKEKVYYVDDVPFLYHDYNTNMDFNISNEERKTTMSAIVGSFSFIN